MATIRELAEKSGRSLDAFAWMAYVMVSVAMDGAEARARAADFLGATYSQDFNPLVDRVAVAGTLERVVEGLVDFVRAGARHLVLLPCHDRAQKGALEGVPWLPELLAGVRSEASSFRGS